MSAQPLGGEMRVNILLTLQSAAVILFSGCMSSYAPGPAPEKIQIDDPPALQLDFYYTHLVHGKPAPKETHLNKGAIEELFEEAVAKTPYLEEATAAERNPEYILEIRATTAQEYRQSYPIFLNFLTLGIYPRTELLNLTVTAGLKSLDGDEIATCAATREMRLTHSIALFFATPFAAADFVRYSETRGDAYREVFSEVGKQLQRLK